MPEVSQLTTLWKGGLGEHAGQWLSDHCWRWQAHTRRTLATRVRSERSTHLRRAQTRHDGHDSA